jgi:hypothetical protein
LGARLPAILDAGSWMLDEKIKSLFLFIQHQASSIQHRSASSNALFKPEACRFEAELR